MASLEPTWLGHASFRFDTPAGKRIYVDPFLHGNPKCPESELEPERVDLVVLTHGHGDHVGDTLAIAQKFGCPVVAQVELRGWLAGQGLPDDAAQSPNKGGTVEFAGVRITFTDANHSSGSDSLEYLGEPAGLVFRIPDAPTVYFAGDTNVFSSMSLIQRLYAPDVAVLPIGTDDYRAAFFVELEGVIDNSTHGGAQHQLLARDSNLLLR